MVTDEISSRMVAISSALLAPRLDGGAQAGEVARVLRDGGGLQPDIGGRLVEAVEFGRDGLALLFPERGSARPWLRDRTPL